MSDPAESPWKQPPPPALVVPVTRPPTLPTQVQSFMWRGAALWRCRPGLLLRVSSFVLSLELMLFMKPWFVFFFFCCLIYVILVMCVSVYCHSPIATTVVVNRVIFVSKEPEIFLTGETVFRVGVRVLGRRTESSGSGTAKVVVQQLRCNFDSFYFASAALKSTTVSKHSAAKASLHCPSAKTTPAAVRLLSQHSQQRSSSARLCRGHTGEAVGCWMNVCSGG